VRPEDAQGMPVRFSELDIVCRLLDPEQAPRRCASCVARKRFASTPHHPRKLLTGSGSRRRCRSNTWNCSAIRDKGTSYSQGSQPRDLGGSAPGAPFDVVDRFPVTQAEATAALTIRAEKCVHRRVCIHVRMVGCLEMPAYSGFQGWCNSELDGRRRVE
jgi:hypothetical protein